VASSKGKKIWAELGLYDKGDGTVGIKNVPSFRNEGEEVKWHDRTHDAVLEFAIQHGLRGKRPARGIAKPTSLRLPPQDLERARKLAERKGLPYQTYIKMLLHEALGKEEKRIA
jgi:predicted HicB family RNase H-like nuclease